jgi:hypothetical protein
VFPGQRKDNLLATRPTTTPEQAPDIEILPMTASVNTHTRQAPAAAVFVFVMANAANPI